METKHTPGPWEFSTSPEGWSFTIHISQEDGAPYTTGYSDVGYIIQTCRGEEESTQMANARLIAAAPELLEALCEATAWLHAHKHTLCAQSICDQVDAAIAKATGQ